MLKLYLKYYLLLLRRPCTWVNSFLEFVSLSEKTKTGWALTGSIIDTSLENMNLKGGRFIGKQKTFSVFKSNY